MSQPVTEPLVLDLVEWVAAAPRTYAEVLEAWRTSCPRLTVWEDAMERGLVACRRRDGDGALLVAATEAGLAARAAARPRQDMAARAVPPPGA
jgi:hypothetical protein